MRHSVLFMIASLGSAGLLAAQDLNITGVGARAEGFAGAFIGIADDATAIVWNPAGLSQLERSEASFVGRFLMEKVEYAETDVSEPGASTDQSHVLFNFGSLALPLHFGRTRLVLAAAYQRQLDFYTNVKFLTTETDGKGGVDTFTPGFGINIGPVFSIGAAVNFWKGKYSETTVDAGYVETTRTQDFTYKGFNVVAGAMIDLDGLPTPIPFKLGVCVRTPFEMKADGTIVDVTSGSAQTDSYEVDQTIQMPLMLGVGTSIRLFESLTLAADYEVRRYADKELRQTTVGAGEETYTISKDDLKQYRIGAEYLIVAKSVVIPIRGGYKSLPTTYRNYTDVQTESNQVVGKAWSVGTGFIFRGVAVDAAYTRSEYTIRYGSAASLKNTTGTISVSMIVYM